MFLNQINSCQLKKKANDVTKTNCKTAEDRFRGNRNTIAHCGLSSLCSCPKRRRNEDFSLSSC